MKTSLVIGGTGMLAGTVKQLLANYEVIGVVARTQANLEALTKLSFKIIPIKTDYSDDKEFKKALQKFSEKYGQSDTVISWIHSTSPEAPIIASEFCKTDFYDITGESGKQKNHISRQRESAIKAKGINYHRVILAHIGNRWLNNDEISDGVYAAIKSNKAEYIVGEIDR